MAPLAVPSACPASYRAREATVTLMCRRREELSSTVGAENGKNGQRQFIDIVT